MAVYYTSPQSFLITFFIRWLNNFFLLNFDWLINLVDRSSFSITNLIYKRGNFVRYHWGCTSIYQPLSYSFYCSSRYYLFYYPLGHGDSKIDNKLIFLTAKLKWHRSYLSHRNIDRIPKTHFFVGGGGWFLFQF